MKRYFRVLKSLGGSGGTIVSRSLVANGALVLSEVNPRSACLFDCALNPLMQLRASHPSAIPVGWRDVAPQTLGDPAWFGRFMADLVDGFSRPLVLRDYSYVDYIGRPFVWPAPKQASLPVALRPYGPSCVALLVRHPADTLRSLLSHKELAGLSTSHFVAGHLAFYRDNPNATLIRFEDFLADPSSVLKTLCEALQLPARPDWLGALGSAAPLTGHRSAMTAHSIVAAPTRDRTPLEDALRSVPGYHRLLLAGGYEAS